VSELQPPYWNSIQNLRICLLDTPPSRANKKFEQIVEALTNHETFIQYNHNLQLIVEMIISKAMFVLNSNKPLVIYIPPEATSGLKKCRNSHAKT